MNESIRIDNILQQSQGFTVLQNARHSQTASLHLAIGQETSAQLNTHENSDQVLVVLEGTMEAQIGEESVTLEKGDSLIVPAGTAHKFSNTSEEEAIAFTAYAPPEY